jgi:glycine betaine/proline transport system substrate-binding protein
MNYCPIGQSEIHLDKSRERPTRQAATTTTFLLMMSSAALAADPESCAAVRLAEPGWNDLALTTGIASVLLEALGYSVKSDILGRQIIYQSLADKDLDAFLGYWDPAMQSFAAPYEKDGTVERIHVNLEGAKYTFGVPDYVYDAGVHDVADLQKIAEQFDRKMYGLEPGSNTLMFDTINDKAFGLDGWDVVESSETGMLSQVARMVDRHEFIVFQAWEPHPMNTAFSIRYLTGGDAHFGPNFGAATVSTQVRKGYVAECPNVGRLLNNLTFNIDFENTGMSYLMNDGMAPKEGAKKLIVANSEVLDAWLDGVTTLDGQPGLPVVKAALGQ